MKQTAAMTSFIIGCFETRTQSHISTVLPKRGQTHLRKTKVSGGMTDSTTMVQIPTPSAFARGSLIGSVPRYPEPGRDAVPPSLRQRKRRLLLLGFRDSRADRTP
jgi:hypothetical protein